jgi:uroporphyrinogen decarboxylase
MWRLVEPDGSNRDIWGAHRRRVRNAFGELDEFASFPLGDADMAALQAYRWPEPDWWDFAPLRSAISNINAESAYLIRFRVGSVFETAWSLYGMERFLLDLASAPGGPLYVMERIAEVHCENLRRALATAGDLIDVVYFYDDLASQKGLLLSPALYGRTCQPLHQRLVDIATTAGKAVMLHSCGAVARLIETFIDMGIRILNPVQPLARDMDAVQLAEQFGGRIVFHGGIDVQQLLPWATAAEVRGEALRVSRLFGQNGGYILAGSHHIQADAPVDNILAMYSL